MPLDQETLDELEAQKRANLIANLGQAVSGGITGQNSAGAYFLGQPNRSNDSADFYGALRAQAAEPALARQREMKSKLDQQALTENSLKLDELKTAMESAKSNKDSSSDVSKSKTKSFQETAYALATSLEKSNPKLASIYRKHAQDIEGKSGATVDAMMSSPLYSNAKDVFAENLKAFNQSQLEGQKQAGSLALERVKEGQNIAKASKPKELTAEQINQLADFSNAKKQLTKLQLSIDENETKMGPKNIVSSLNPFNAESQAFSTEIGSTVQNIGKGLEGGKLTDKDREFYQKMAFSTLTPPDTARAKVAKLDDMIKTKEEAFLKTLKDNNYRIPDSYKSMEDSSYQEPKNISFNTSVIPEAKADGKKQGVTMEHIKKIPLSQKISELLGE